MPEKTWWKVEIVIQNNIAGYVEIPAQDAEAAEDAVADLIKLTAKKAYKKGQENEQKTESTGSGAEAEAK